MSAIRKTAQILTGQLLIFAQSLVLTPIVIKVAGPEIYGAYILLLSYMGIMFGISSLGVGISAKRWLPSASSAAERAAWFYPQFWFQILSILFIAILSVAAFVVLSASLKWQFPGFSVWLILAYLLTYTLYSQTADYFRYTHRLGTFNISTVAQPYFFIFTAVGIYWATGILNAGSLVESLTVTFALIGGLLFLLICKEIGLQLRLPERDSLAKEIKLGFPLILSYLVDVILSGGDRYIIAVMLSVRDVGTYVPAYALGSLAMVLPKVFGVVLPPLISQRIDADDESGAKKLTTGAARIFLLMSIPYVAGAAILGKAVLRLYANTEVAEAAWLVIPIIALASIFYGLILLRANILFVRLKTAALFQINLISAVLNIVFNIVLIKVFGNVIVAAFATLASYLFSYLLLSRKLKGDMADFSLDRLWLLRVLLCSAGMAWILFFSIGRLEIQGLVSLGFGVLAGGATYALLIFMQESNRVEFRMFAQSWRLR